MDPAPLLREVAKMLAATLPSSLELVVEIEPDTPDIRMDPVRLYQALTNLIINARDALSGQGRVQLTLRYAGPRSGQCDACHKDFQGDYVEIAVADDGPGIAPEILHRIFDPFFTTKEVGKGSGMGLAMVMGVLREVDGHVVVETAPGKGTAFRLLIPARARNGEESAGS
jgi:signal transduction histidine kinase